VGAHKAILACRCKFFCEAFQGVWGKDHSTVVINNRVLNPTALQGLFEFLYTNRIDLPRSAWEDFKKLCKQLKMLDLFNSFEKSIKQGNLDVQVLIYDRTSARLLSDLRNDFYKLLELSNTSPEQESQTLPSFSERVRAVQPLQRNPKYFPDLCLVVEGYSFFCHKIFLHYRSDYFRTLFSSGFLEANSLRDSAEQHISDCPVIRLSETRSEIMGYLLEFIYSNNISRLEEFEEETLLEIFYAADMYLIPQLQTTVGFYLIRFIRLDNALSYWSLAVDFDLKRLEKSSMEFIALNLQEFLKEKEFLEIVSQSASEIQNRQEVDSIPVIDDIRFILNKYIARYPESHPDHLRLIELEEALAVWLENTNFDC
jgi:ankyrin repeat/BTB/POZ domain-containing protein 1